MAALGGIYGIYAFRKREVGSYLFLQSHFVYFDYSEPYVRFLLDYISIIALLIWLGFGLSRWKSK